MSTVSTVTEHIERPQRREDFQLETFRHLEAKLQVLRKIVMDEAAEIAALEGDEPDVYRVDKEHVDLALKHFFSNHGGAMHQLGIEL